jgi:hypothetical protein
MLVAMFALLMMIAFLDKTLRLDRRKFVIVETELKIDAIRDDILLKVLDGEQPDNEWYKYFDEHLEGVSHCLGVTPIIWTVGLILSFFGLTEEKEQLGKRQQFERALEEPENHHLANAYAAYKSALLKFVNGRHPALAFLARRFKVVERRINDAERKLPPTSNGYSGMFSHLRFHS